MKEKQESGSLMYLGVIFILSLALGYFVKKIAVRYVTVGFEDSQIKAVKSAYSFQEIKEKSDKIKEDQQKKMEEQAKAQGMPAGASAPVPVASEGASCDQ